MSEPWQEAWDRVDLREWGTVCHDIQRKPFDEQMKRLEGLAKHMHIQGWNDRDAEIEQLRAENAELRDRLAEGVIAYG
jgi:hypothetical protein